MKNIRLPLFASVSALLLSGVSAFAGGKEYQVTGPVVSVSDTTIVVQKGKENWEITRGADTKVTGDVKEGDKVTVQYTMTASSIENKGASKPAAGAKKEKPAADAAPAATKPAPAAKPAATAKP